jgi:predicted RNase H-like HicB family nuclease
MIIRAIIEWDEEAQAYSATCPELNFISSFSNTKGEAISNLEDAIKLMLEPIPDEIYSSDSSSEQIELVLL